MPDATLAAGAIGAGVLVSTAVLVVCGGAMSAYRVVRTSVRNTVARIVVARSARARLAVDLDRAGCRESPERICVLAIALAACLAVLGATTISALTTSGAVVVCGTGILGGLGLPFVALRSAIARRRRRLEGELVPLLELFTLEQGVGALATDLRRSQRRDLIAHSRRALNHVLLPAAVGVLLPFLAVLMFPAVTALQRNLR